MIELKRNFVQVRLSELTGELFVDLRAKHREFCRFWWLFAQLDSPIKLASGETGFKKILFYTVWEVGIITASESH